jgi:hemerythrin-like metal-binding protein
MAFLNWTEKFSTGVKEIDRQHMGLVDALNELHAAMMKGHAGTVTGPLLQKLLDYTHDHFSWEENMLSGAGYPALDAHRKHHEDLNKQVNDFVIRYQSGERMNLELLTFLHDWLTNHIQKEDRAYGPWMNGHGVH